MDYWSGKKNIKIPKLGFGTWQMQGANCTKAVLTALETGYRHIDTAQIYENEEDVGKALVESDIDREELFIVTKVWRKCLNFREALVSVGRSLDHLQTDFVDLLLIHWPNSSTPIEETLSAFKELIQTKKVKHIGVSNFTTSLLKQVKKLNPSILCNQVEYHPFLNQNKLLTEIKKTKMFLTAYSPLARGELTNHSVLKSIGSKYGKTPAQIILRWLLNQEPVVAIPKAQTEKHIKENFNIFDFQLDPEDKKKIDLLTTKNKRLVNPEWAPKWDT